MNQHKLQSQVKRICELRLPIYVHGPTGCGKTYMFKNIAKELGLSFYKKLIGAQMTEASLLGYNDAHGKYNEGICYKPYTEGGMILLDEIDNGNANTNLVVNGLCDEEMSFPTGMKVKHKNCVIVATANTCGAGATIEYVGRNRLDAAMLNRFVFVAMDYDYALERKLATEAFWTTLGRDLLPDEIEIFEQSLIDFWLVRKVIDELGIKHIISQRNLIQQSIMLAAGISGAVIADSVIIRNLDVDTRNKIIENTKKVAIDAFKQQLLVKTVDDLITDEHRKRILSSVEEEAQKLLDAKINELANKIRYVELEIAKTKKFNESQKFGEIKLSLEQKEKELKELKMAADTIKQKEAEEAYKKLETLLFKSKYRPKLPELPELPALPNWDEKILGGTDDTIT